jgi:hypothetical protein
VIEISAPGLESQKVLRTGGGKVARLVFTDGKLGPFRVNLDTRRPLQRLHAEVPAFVAPADVFKGYVAVESLLDADVGVASRDRLEPVDPSEARSLPPRRATGPMACAFAFGGPNALVLSVSRHTLVAGIPLASPEARATTAWEANGASSPAWHGSSEQRLDFLVTPPRPRAPRRARNSRQYRDLRSALRCPSPVPSVGVAPPSVGSPSPPSPARPAPAAACGSNCPASPAS